MTEFGKFIGWRQAIYVVVVVYVFGVGFDYLLNHPHQRNWWAWLLLVVYVLLATAVLWIWQRRLKRG